MVGDVGRREDFVAGEVGKAGKHVGVVVEEHGSPWVWFWFGGMNPCLNASKPLRGFHALSEGFYPERIAPERFSVGCKPCLNASKPLRGFHALSEGFYPERIAPERFAAGCKPRLNSGKPLRGFHALSEGFIPNGLRPNDLRRVTNPASILASPCGASTH
ncbi:MAG: hypothetical protein N2049_00385 [Anaerolineales bacterium]|nr:hypothetical protein [Anaerolineales bacterium]